MKFTTQQGVYNYYFMPRDEKGRNRKEKVNRDKQEVHETADDWEKLEEYTKKANKEEGDNVEGNE